MAKKEKIDDPVSLPGGPRASYWKIRERYRALLESVPDAMLIVDSEGKICFGNGQMEEFFGYSAEELVGKGVEFLIPGRYRKKHLDDLHSYFSVPRRRTMGTGLDIVALRKDGTEFPVDIALSPLSSEEGDYVVAAIRDMTMRKEAEDRIRMNYHLQRAMCSILHGSLEPIPLEEQLEQVLEKILTVPHLALHSRGAVYLVEDKPDVLILKAHRGFDPVHLQTCREVPFGTCLCGEAAETGQILFATGVDARHQLLAGALHPHGHYCVPIVCGDKTLGLLNISVKEGHTRSSAEEEFLTAVSNMLAGIIERKRAERAMVASEEKYRTLVENVNIGVYRNTGGPHGRFLQANPAIAKMFGFDTVEDFMKVSVADLYLNPEERKAVMHEVLQQGYIQDKEIPLKKKDGTPIWGSFTARVHYDDAGDAQWLDGVIEDITERKEAEEEQKKLQRKLAASEKYAALGRLTQNIAHEIRNPLTAVGGFAKRLQQHLTGEGKERKYVDLILSDVQRLEEILKNVLTFSRDDALHLERVRLAELLEQALRSLETTCRDHSISIEKVYGKIPDLSLDRKRVEEALEVMVSNAIASMPQGGTLSIQTGEVQIEGKAYTFLLFKDTGEGIPPAVMEKIFEPFFTGEGAVPGTRLGLPICRKVMESHGGMIRVESTPGEGTTFRLYFPQEEVP